MAAFVRRIRRGPAIAGVVLVVLAAVWLAVGVPVLARFPDDLDVNARFSGEFSTYVDQETMLPLEEPDVQPLRLDRQVAVQSSSFSDVVITEDVTIRPGDQVMRYGFRYVMDRRSMRFGSDPRTEAFSASDVADPAGTHRVQFPLGTSPDRTYRSWNNETGRYSVLRGGSPAHFHPEAGVEVVDFDSALEAPARPYYVDWLVEQGFPRELTPTQLAPRLAAMGIDVAAVITQVRPQLTADEAALLDEVLATPVPIEYRFYFAGQVAIEPQTGSLMDVHARQEGVKAAPDLSGLDRLRPLLDRYAGIPAVAAVTAGLDSLAASPPEKVIELIYRQTAASSAELGAKARSQARKLDLVERWVPWALTVGGVVLLALALVLRRRPPAPPEAVPAAAPPPSTKAEPEEVLT